VVPDQVPGPPGPWLARRPLRSLREASESPPGPPQGAWDPSGDPVPRGFYINPSRRGPAVPAGGPGSPSRGPGAKTPQEG